jgi:hypothetical protein
MCQLSQRMLVFILSILILASNCLLNKARAIEEKYSHNSSVISRKSTTHIDIDRLPNLIDVLEEVRLFDYLREFIKLGVLETVHLLRLSSMDYHIMSYEWGNITDSDISRLRTRIEELRQLATVEDEVKRPDLEQRKQLNYGRIYLKNGVQTIEYVSASFGGPPPLGYHPIHMPEQRNEFGCKAYDRDLTGLIQVVRRGVCTFLQKSLNAFSVNASGVLIINSEDRVESLSSGLGINPEVKEREVKLLENFPIISASNTSWPKLQRSMEFYNESHPPMIAIVPLRCGIGLGMCEPVTKEERAYQPSITWGLIHMIRGQTVSKAFQFLTSEFGGQLPAFNSSYGILVADPLDACESLKNAKDSYGRIVIVVRGNCRFDVKAMHVDAIGGRLTVIVDRDDNPLQRLGGLQPTAGMVGIPSILVHADFLDFIRSTTDLSSIEARIEPGDGYAVSDAWIEVAHMEWESNYDALKGQLDDLIRQYQDKKLVQEVVDWLKRKLKKLHQSSPELGRRVLTTYDTVTDEL